MSHLCFAPAVNSFQVMTIKAFLEEMEDAGEIITFMGHTKEGESMKCNDNLVFLMDEIKSSKRRKISKACFAPSEEMFQEIGKRQQQEGFRRISLNIQNKT